MYETEEQQVEALKKWWKENGTSIIAGVVIGLGSIFGWRAWIDHSHGVAARASNAFDQLVYTAENNDLDSADKQAEALVQEYDNTPYSAFADLMQARVRFEQGDMVGVKSALEQALAKAPDPAMATITVLRLARIELSQGNTDSAEKLLQAHPAPAAFIGEYEALKGDIAVARGDTAAARAAYQLAIANQVGNADLVQLKLDNLPPAS